MAKTLVSEISAPPYQAMTMGLTSGCWSLGLVIGPALGGLLANPCKLYPETFGNNMVFATYPYLLPNLINSILAFVAFILVMVYFPETLPVRSFEVTQTEDVSNEHGPIDTCQKQEWTREVETEKDPSVRNMSSIEEGWRNKSRVGDSNSVKSSVAASGAIEERGDGQSTSSRNQVTCKNTRTVTHTKLHESDDVVDESDYRNDSEKDHLESEEKRGASVWELVKTPGVMSGIFAYFWLSYVSI